MRQQPLSARAARPFVAARAAHPAPGRLLLLAVLVAVAVTLAAFPRARATMPGAGEDRRMPAPPGAPAFVVPGLALTDAGKFWSFPNIAMDPLRGTVIVIYEDSAGDGVAGSTLVYRTSADGGRTWGARRYPIAPPAPGHSRGVGSIVATRAGRWVLTWKDSDYPRFDWTSYVQYSDDAGGMWSAPRRLAGFSAWNFATGGAIETARGTLLFPVYGEDARDPADNAHTRAGIFRSADNGATWSFRPISVADDNYSEIGLVELPGGHIRAYIRNDSSSTFATSESASDGTTWGVPAPLAAFTIWPSMPGVVRVPGSDRLVLFYRQRGTAYAAYRSSDDLGTTWGPERIYSYERQAYAGLAMLGPTLLGGVVGLERSASSAYISFFTMHV